MPLEPYPGFVPCKQPKLSREQAREKVLDHYGRTCACCGATERLSIDHVVPVRWNRPRNIYLYLVRRHFPEGFQVLCRPCNSSKSRGTHCRLAHHRDPEELALTLLGVRTARRSPRRQATR